MGKGEILCWKKFWGECNVGKLEMEIGSGGGGGVKREMKRGNVGIVVE